MISARVPKASYYRYNKNLLAFSLPNYRQQWNFLTVRTSYRYFRLHQSNFQLYNQIKNSLGSSNQRRPNQNYFFHFGIDESHIRHPLNGEPHHLWESWVLAQNKEVRRAKTVTASCSSSRFPLSGNEKFRPFAKVFRISWLVSVSFSVIIRFKAHNCVVHLFWRIPSSSYNSVDC